MVSTVETSGPKHVKDMDTVVPKAEPPRDASISSSVSTPEPEADVVNRDVTQTQKRKGGRKPVRTRKAGGRSVTVSRACGRRQFSPMLMVIDIVAV